jgi:4-hydroxy-tetrahydrodipicolinate synthase
MICGIGAAGTKMTIDLAAVACEEGAKALLLPMPYFFPYKQPDLNAFCRAVAASTPLDVMLYNLPQFTSGLTKETVRTLISEVPNIIGIKDSSGSLDILRDLTHHQIDACRIVGNDSALAPALVEGVCDGVVSGVACALPELILEVYGQGHETAGAPFQSSTKLLAQFITQLDQFPTPWGLKWIVEARGVMQATFSQPVAQHRLEQAEAMAKWFAAWLPGALPSASSAV